jgi:hypothetical protein
LGLAETILELSTSAALFSAAKHGGIHAVYELIGDACEAMLEAEVPAYLAAVEACQSIPGCIDKLRETRTFIVQAFCEAIGLDVVLKEVLKYAGYIPDQVLEALAVAGDDVKVIKDLLSGNPNISEMYTAAYKTVPYLLNATKEVLAQGYELVGSALIFSEKEASRLGAGLVTVSGDLASGNILAVPGDIGSVAVGSIGDAADFIADLF